MRRLSFVALAATTLLLGCGGGGAGTAAGGSGGGGSVLAGPLRVEGQVSAPQGAVLSGVTTYVVTGNITSATLTDQSPAADETEIFTSEEGPDGFAIKARNGDGTGEMRTIVQRMSQAALPIKVDPANKFVYYLRNNNLQRTSISDGTSNTILGSVSSFCFNVSGTKLIYRKGATDELWTANLNGTGQTLVRHISVTFQVLGGADDESVGIRDQAKFQTVRLSDGHLGLDEPLEGFIFRWIAYSPSERAAYVSLSASSNTIARSFVPPIDHYWIFRSEFSSTGPIESSIGVSVGPGKKLVGVDNSTGRLEIIESDGNPVANWPPDVQIFSTYWALNTTSWQLAGAGTAFPSGLGVLMSTELGKLTPSVVAADAVTRSSIAVTSLNDTTVGNPLYRIDCDNLKTLAYANRNGYAWHTVVGAPSGLKGALVSFDSATGAVANIITFTKGPVVTRQGKGWRVEGELSEVMSPRGARRAAGRSVIVP